jgi:tetratricopeptide (TPR) repeat protein
MIDSKQSNGLTGSANTLMQLLTVTQLEQKLSTVRQAGNRFNEMQLLGEIGLTYEKIRNGAKALEYHQQALTIARELGQRGSEATILKNAAAVHLYVTGNQRIGLDNLRQSLAIWQELGNEAEEAETHMALLLLFLHQRNYAAARQEGERALALQQALGDLAAQVSTLQGLANIYRDEGKLDSAEAHLEKALRIDRDRDDRKGQAATLSRLAALHHWQHDTVGALERYDLALALLREIGDRSEEARLLHDSGYVQGDTKGTARLTQALAIYRELGDRKGQIMTLTAIGEAYYIYEKSLSGALKYYQEALANAQEIKDPQSEAACLTTIGWLYLNQNNLPKALASYEQALPIRRKVGDPRGNALTASGLGRVYQQLGRLEEALPLLETAVSLDEQTQSNDLNIHRTWLDEVRQALKRKRR